MAGKKPKLYIAYGSNINLKQMKYRCPHSKVVGTAMIKDWKLEFRGVANIVPKPGAEVPVLLWELDPRDEPSLNAYEGWPRLYRQQDITFDYGEQKVTGMAYLMNLRGISPPSVEYFQTIWTGYTENGLDTSYLMEAVKDAYAYQVSQPEEPLVDDMEEDADDPALGWQ